MKARNGVRVSTATAIPLPAALALPALETVLKEFAKHPRSASLALDIEQLRVPFQAMVSVPVQAHVLPGESRNEWRLQIRAASKPQMYPAFDGVLTLVPATRNGSQLELSGAYIVPFGLLGRTLDVTLLRGMAQSSLQRFLRDVANRIAALSRWAQLHNGYVAALQLMQAWLCFARFASN